MRSISKTIRRLAGPALAGLTALSLFTSVAVVAQEKVELSFTYWGSAFEKKDIEVAIQTFNDTHPNIQVNGQHIPGGTNYIEKITTLVAAGTPPDVAYLGEGQAFKWLEDGTLLDLTPYFDGNEADYVKSILYHVDDKLLGTGLATGAILTYFNKDIFDAAGLAYPPSKAEDAWDWDTLVENAKLLTKDSSGRNANDPEFDPENISTYGITYPTWWGGYLPLIWSNGGDYANAEGTELLLNQPEAVEVLQALQDLIYKYHVAPTPTVGANLPTADILLQSSKVAIAIDGMWKVTDFANLRFNWGVGVLPKFDTAQTVIISTPKVIFAGTKHPKEAFEFYQFIANPEEVALFKEGLWAPLELAYFTDEDKIASWLTAQPGVYPPEARDAIVNYTLNNAPNQPAAYWLRNFGQINTEAVEPALQQLWAGTITAQQAADQAAEAAKPLLAGRY